MTFREMRRGKQQLTREESEAILLRGTAGVLAVLGDGGYPYAVPVSYVYENGVLYLHGAKSGHRLDAVARDDRVSFCVIDRDELVPERFTTYFRSVIAFGRARILEDEDERRAALARIAVKYGPADAEAERLELEKTLPRTTLIAIAVEHLTGKEAKELRAARNS